MSKAKFLKQLSSPDGEPLRVHKSVKDAISSSSKELKKFHNNYLKNLKHLEQKYKGGK